MLVLLRFKVKIKVKIQVNFGKNQVKMPNKTGKKCSSEVQNYSKVILSHPTYHVSCRPREMEVGHHPRPSPSFRSQKSILSKGGTLPPPPGTPKSIGRRPGSAMRTLEAPSEKGGRGDEGSVDASPDQKAAKLKDGSVDSSPDQKAAKLKAGSVDAM